MPTQEERGQEVGEIPAFFSPSLCSPTSLVRIIKKRYNFVPHSAQKLWVGAFFALQWLQ